MIRLLAVGKLKDKRLADLVAEYGRRIQALAPFAMEEVKDSSPPKEARALLARLGSRAGTERVIALDERGDRISSRGLAELLGRHGSVTFLIGGPDGLDDSVRQRADRILRLSALTLTHEMARLLLAEQIYRALSIRNNRPYHRD